MSVSRWHFIEILYKECLTNFELRTSVSCMKSEIYSLKIFFSYKKKINNFHGKSIFPAWYLHNPMGFYKNLSGI